MIECPRCAGKEIVHGETNAVCMSCDYWFAVPEPKWSGSIWDAVGESVAIGILLTMAGLVVYVLVASLW